MVLSHTMTYDCPGATVRLIKRRSERERKKRKKKKKRKREKKRKEDWLELHTTLRLDLV